LPAIGLGLQSMMHMDRIEFTGESWPEFSEEMK
jgi:hypothetical protein